MMLKDGILCLLTQVDDMEYKSTENENKSKNKQKCDLLEELFKTKELRRTRYL